MISPFPRPQIYDRFLFGRMNGQSWGDMHSHIAEKRALALANGHSNRDVDDYLGWGPAMDLEFEDASR